MCGRYVGNIKFMLRYLIIHLQIPLRFKRKKGSKSATFLVPSVSGEGDATYNWLHNWLLSDAVVGGNCYTATDDQGTIPKLPGGSLDEI